MKEMLKTLGYVIVFLMGAFILWDYGRHAGQNEVLSLCERGIRIEKIAENIYKFRPVTVKEYSKTDRHYWTELNKLRKELYEKDE